MHNLLLYHETTTASGAESMAAPTKLDEINILRADVSAGTIDAHATTSNRLRRCRGNVPDPMDGREVA